MMSTPNIDRYDDVRLGNMVTLLTLDGLWQDVLPLAHLKLDNPAPLIAVARKAAEAAPAAHYDDETFQDWVRWPHLVGRAFRQDTLETLSQADQARFYNWLENGMTSGMHDFPYRILWYDACVWAWRRDEVVEHIDDSEINTVRTFATEVAEAVRSDAYKAALEDLCQNQDTYADTYFKTKFHINFVPNVLIRPQLVDIGYMRRSHILRAHAQAFIDGGGAISKIERMVRAYAGTLRGSKHITKYIECDANFAFDVVWNGTFTEGRA